MKPGTLRPSALAILLACASIGASSCDREASSSLPAEPAAEEVSTPALPSGASLLEGTYLFETQYGEHELSVGMRFHDGTFERINRGIVTATEAFTIVEDSPGRVVVELRSEASPPKRRELVFPSVDAVFDSADPDMVYLRVADSEGLEGSGLTE